MTGRAVAERLGQRGLDAGHIDAARRLFDLAIHAFGRLARHPPDHAWWIPGRLEVFGRHTDYAGGHALVCAVPRGFALVARRRTDGIVRLLDAVRDDVLVIDTDPSGPARTGWRTYPLVVTRRLRRNFPGAAIGADVVFASDLPSASGMSSSSALVTGVAAALAHLAELPARPDWQRTLRMPADEAGYYACLENGMRFGPLAGDAGVGTHGGSEDHVAIVCGRARELAAWTFVPIASAGTAPLPADWTFVIAASGAAARKTGQAKEAYNRLSQDARTLLDVWNRAESPRGSLRDALTVDPSAPGRLIALVRDSGLDPPGIAALERRLRHFLHEDARVLDALQAFRAADAGRLGPLSDASQAEAEALLGNQVPETVALAQAARARGAFAACSFGAGFGGSVWALVGHDEAPAFAEEWLFEYRARFPERTGATAFVACPGPPLTHVF